LAWKWNHAIKIATVITNIARPARRFSNQTRMSPIKDVRNARNMYIEEF
jgi:hypothetical protein